ncbi:hypothetical protein [Bradyrhizobium sp. I1.14.4]|uniref:hypothetical protein n=1 Tax=unclassified Bradyrhizobium TaxID=2631580 RepID=UPI003D24FFA8
MEKAEKVNQAPFGKSVKTGKSGNLSRRDSHELIPERDLVWHDPTTGQVIFISYFFSPRNDDRCFLADSGSAIQLGPSMIRMLGPF